VLLFYFYVERKIVKSGQKWSRQKVTILEGIWVSDDHKEHETLLHSCEVKLDFILNELYIRFGEFLTWKSWTWEREKWGWIKTIRTNEQVALSLTKSHKLVLLCITNLRGAFTIPTIGINDSCMPISFSYINIKISLNSGSK